MAKGSFASDTFEQLAEFGQSTAKTTVQSMAQTFNPVKILEGVSDKGQRDQERDGKPESAKQGKNNTPLDFEHLQKKYDQQETEKKQALRNRLFQLVKSGEEKIMQDKKREEEEKKRKEEQEKQQKQQKEQQRKQQEASAQLPQGKMRRSIFSHKKAAERRQVEVKANSGKQ